MAKKTQLDRLATKVQQEMDASTTRLADKLRGELSSDDAHNMSQEDWHAMIVRNWANPAFRQTQAQRLGDVKLAEDALAAYGLPPLKQSLAAEREQQPTVATPDTPTQQ